MAIRRLLPAAACALALAACTTGPHRHAGWREAEPEVRTAAVDELLALPPPERPLAVAVYSFLDLTGQNKPSEAFPEYSRAVTQGANSVLITALQRAGNNSWFTVVDRGGLQALLQERQIIRQMRETYGGDPTLPPLTYAGVILDGGIIGYDSNTVTGGAGARFLGIGGDVQYRRDSVTVYLRAISVQSGKVLTSISTTKTIASVAGRAGTFRYVDFKELLEIEAGVTTNEPVTLAVREAIEKAVLTLILEGVLGNHWRFQDRAAERTHLEAYLSRRDGTFDARRLRADAPGAQPRAAPGNGVTLPPPAGVTPRPGAAGATPLEPGPHPAAPPQGQPGPTYVLPGPGGRSPIPGVLPPQGAPAGAAPGTPSTSPGPNE
ncbi:MAG TPA: CsgG/HfaB family protein [Azospirillaceae bacterium]|nr:CsgG/HfaB family protein [Azospirillaceae bacterium]